MFDISSWGQRIVDENELEGARWRWELYQGEEGRQHYELDRQMAQVRTWAKAVAESMDDIRPALQESLAQLAAVLQPIARTYAAAVREIADLAK